MGNIDGTRRLSQLSIPGTHDSGALYEPLGGTAKCQNTTITQQLNFGVRFLDIRCCDINDAFYIYHGSVDERQTFIQVLDQVIGFLNSNPSECVIMSVKSECTPSGTTRSFEATFDSYVATNPSKWYLGSTVPALNTVRGQIVLLRRFSATALPKGIDATYWPDNAAPGFTGNYLAVEDWYVVTDNPTKWTYINNGLSAAFGDSNADILHLTFTSGYLPGGFGIPNIPTVSNYINPLLLSYFAGAPVGHYGCVNMDFVDAIHSELIYGVNFHVSGPLVGFSASPLSGAVPLNVSFTNQSVGATNYRWTFGDGNTSSGTNPANAYTLTGTYSVTLAAIGSGVTNSLTSTNYILATNIPPVNLPLLVLTPPTLDFGTAFSGSTASASLVVSNAGFSLLSGTATILGGPFTMDGGNGAGLSVPALSATNLAVQFSPLAAGVFSNAIVFATDGGSATNSLYGVGADLPVILSATQAGTNVVFYYLTIPGKTYTIEYEDFFDSQAWLPLQTVTGDGSTNAFTNSTAAPSQRFYRLSVR